MGAIANAITAYTQPLIDATDGSMEQMERALLIGQLCWNLALLPEDKRATSLGDLRLKLSIDEDEFDSFRRSVVGPMIRRHEEMFPQLHREREPRFPPVIRNDLPVPRSQPKTAAAEKYPGTDRYAPCPCNSGRKYKFCCGAKSR